MEIDHYIQLDILNKLANSDTPIKYSELKDDSIENSLFSYHLNKLIQRDMVVKSEDGYKLSIDGARWLNDNTISMKNSDSPRIAIALVIKNKDDNYLIGQRTGQFNLAINDYLLPSSSYSNDTDLNSQIDTAIAEFIPDGQLVETSPFGFIQANVTYTDKIGRILFNLSLCLTENFTPNQPKEFASYEWLSREQINAINHPSAGVLRDMIDYVADNKNSHKTPVFYS